MYCICVVGHGSMDRKRQLAEWVRDYVHQFQRFHAEIFLRVSAQTDRQVQVRESMTPLRNAENALFVYIKEPRRADKDIPLLLRPLNTKLVNAVEYDMIDVNDFMEDMSRSQRHRYLLQLQQGMSVPMFHYTWTWGGSRAGFNLHVI